MTKRATYNRTMYIGNVVQIADDLGHVINPAQNDAPNDKWIVYQITVGVAAVHIIPAAGLPAGQTSPTERVAMNLVNLGPATIYLGPSNAVAVATHYPLLANSTITIALGPNLDLWAISAGAGNDVRVMEIG